jgi:lipopolysaccharide biosynthesis regulator YciM
VALDTYRDWLHRRSACPECGLTRYQTVDGRWHCPGCEGF